MKDCPSISNLINDDTEDADKGNMNKDEDLAEMSSRNFRDEYLVAESSVGRESQSPLSSTSWANQRLNLVDHLNKQSSIASLQDDEDGILPDSVRGDRLDSSSGIDCLEHDDLMMNMENAVNNLRTPEDLGSSSYISADGNTS